MKILQLFFVFIFVLTCSIVSGQIVAIVGYNGSNPDGYSIVATEDIPGGTVIYFTDREYDNSTDQFTFNEEGVWTYTTPAGGLSEGDVVTFAETSSDNFTIDCNLAPSDCGSFNLVNGVINFSDTVGDAVYAYDDDDTEPANGVTEIYAVLLHQGELPALEDPTPDFPNAVVVDVFDPSPSGSHREFLESERSSFTSKADIETLTNYNAPTGNSNVDLSETAFAGGVLPVELVSFDAQRAFNHVVLKWSTATELNNMGFEIEKSNDARDWEKLGFVEGYGSVNETRYYQYIDEAPYSGINYYRLKQMDYDGNYEYSPISTVTISGKKEISIYPTVASDFVHVKYDAAFGKLSMVEIFSIVGEKIEELPLPEEDDLFNLNISSFNNGHYFLKVTSGDNIYTERFIKK